MRVGIGTDTHAFAEGKPLWLGCIEWPGEVGLAGHSDGDVAAHAICDALFSAAGLGDLGSNFGSDRPEFAGAASRIFLVEAARKVAAAGFSISNVAVQIVGNKPRITAKRGEMEHEIGAALGGVPVSVSATTTDGLGFTGRGEGLTAVATCLLTLNA